MTILLPINVKSCSPEAFEWVNRFGRSSPLTLTLLHVVTLNVLAAENRVYEELCQEAQGYLERLAREYVAPGIDAVVRVRLGNLAAELQAQARADHSELLLLPVLRPLNKTVSPLDSPHRFSPTVSGLARRVLKNAPCEVLVLPTSAAFDCQKKWNLASGPPQQPARLTPTVHAT